MHFVVTGGRGYLGRAVVAQALREGHKITVLGAHEPPAAAVRSVSWRLRDPVPQVTWIDPVDAVIHLAHVWHDTAPEADDANLVGTRKLIDAGRAAGVKRFVFASSLSARADARNRYGRVKYRIESLLDRPGEVAARIGLVYGGAAQSLWGVLRRLAKLPVLPVIGARQDVQPIHNLDVARGLVRLATATAVPSRIVLATEPPIAFGQFLQEIAWRIHRRHIILFDLPRAADPRCARCADCRRIAAQSPARTHPRSCRPYGSAGASRRCDARPATDEPAAGPRSRGTPPACRRDRGRRSRC